MVVTRYLAGFVLAFTVGSVECLPLAQDGDKQRPNVLLIVVDDMGWSDLGSFGSEIRTPNLDAMASEGVTMTNFHTAPTCSPTRSMLLTGVDNHLAGVGTMENLQAPNQKESENYAAELNDKVVTVAEVLADNGYTTMMSGKWHLAESEANYPHRRGFDKSFALLQGGASHFADRLPLYKGNHVDYLENGTPATLPDDFYSSISYTDKLIQFLEESDSEQPFFAYLALTAPHDPLQVPDDWLDKYEGVYSQGPDEIRLARIQRQKALGLFPETLQAWTPSTFPEWLPIGQKAWANRSEPERKRVAKSMEIYASMVEIVDQQVGRVSQWLAEHDELDNTLIIFMSDNGANSSTPLLYQNTSGVSHQVFRQWFLSERDQSLEHLGKAGSHAYQGMEWAVVSNTPYAFYKATVGEGGIRVPLIVKGPGVEAGQRSTVNTHVKDIAPTIFDLAGIEVTDSRIYEGKYTPQGQSLLSLWQGSSANTSLETRVIGTELFGSKAVIKGAWKARNITPPMGSGEWELFNLQQDPGELNNLAANHPQVLLGLIEEYTAYSTANGIIPPQPPIRPSVQALYAGPCNWWCEFQLDVLDSAIAVQAYFSE